MTPGFFVARHLTAPTKKRDYPLRILASTKDTVTLPASAGTTAPGQWGLYYDGHGHVTISGTPTIDEKTATWRVIRGTPPPEGTRVAWTGIVRPTPGAAGFLAHDHHFDTPAGSAPAWFIGATPGSEERVWTVHIYGRGSTRAGVLRGVEATAVAELPAVLPTYRNSFEGPRSGHGRIGLGSGETEDIAAALAELSVTGDEKFILVGWSMGAQIALSLATDARWRSRVIGLVLESPVIDWRRTLAHNGRRLWIPPFVGSEARLWLESPTLSRMVGMERPVDFDSMDFLARADEVAQPVLILHGDGDNSTPISASREFARIHGNTTLVETKSRHTSGWNVDQHLWSDSVTDFVSDVNFSARR